MRFSLRGCEQGTKSEDEVHALDLVRHTPFKGEVEACKAVAERASFTNTKEGLLKVGK